MHTLKSFRLNRVGHTAVWCVRFILLLVTCHISLSAIAQATGSWQIYPAYTVCTKSIPVGNRVYALMETNLMAYDTEDSSITTWHSMNGLNDVGIQYVDYSADAQRLILVYDNGSALCGIPDEDRRSIFGHPGICA